MWDACSGAMWCDSRGKGEWSVRLTLLG
uniref:Uncharacterized protein n=1 Tax=Arundo donax TaxID=35708 RepID=A0A0A9BX63_ARUDO